MKKRLFLTMACFFSAVFGALFLVGLVWSLIPFGGETLPHQAAGWLGVSFGWSAMLISSVLGFAFVGFAAMGAIIHAIASDSGIEW